MAEDPRSRLLEFRKFVEASRSSRSQFSQPNYTSPIWLATAQAICLDLPELACIEFGVAQGRGFLSMVEICNQVTDATGIRFQLFGFDTTTGLPPLLDYRDHPEIWYADEYALEDRGLLFGALPSHARIVEGDMRETVPTFVQTMDDIPPLGFVSVDVDMYSSTVAALQIFLGSASNYLPSCMMYFDDIDGLVTLNEWCGEELAIREFNALPTSRRIQRKVTHTPKSFACHILDHPVRLGNLKPATPLEIPASLFS